MRRNVIYALALEIYVSAIGHDKAPEYAQGGSLAASGRPEQCDKLFLGDIQRNIVKNLVVIKFNRNILKTEKSVRIMLVQFSTPTTVICIS